MLARQPPPKDKPNCGVLSRLFGTSKTKTKKPGEPESPVDDTQFLRLQSAFNSAVEPPPKPEPKAKPKAKAASLSKPKPKPKGKGTSVGKPSAKAGPGSRYTAQGVVPVEPSLEKRLQKCGIEAKLLSTVGSPCHPSNS